MGVETVLVAIGPGDADRTEKLAETAKDIAGPNDATVVLAHVFEKESYERTKAQLKIGPEAEVTPDDVATRYTTIRSVAASLDAAGVEHEAVGRIGRNDSTLVELIDELDPDLVLVGGRTRSPTGKALFGSTAQEVMLASSAPVTFVRAD